jgi:hypothetical protein
MRIDNITTRPGDIGLVPSASFATTAASVQVGSVPIWTSTGTMTIGATTTVPVYSPVSRDVMYYRQIGPKEWQINVIFDKGGTGGVTNSGNGDYLLTLPTACPDFSFDVLAIAYQLGVASNEPVFGRVALATSSGFANHNITNAAHVGIVPWSARQFRVLLGLPGTSIRCWGSGWFPISFDAMGLSVQFTYQGV